MSQQDIKIDQVVYTQAPDTGEGTVTIEMDTRPDTEAMAKRLMAYGEMLIGIRKTTGFNRKEFAERLGIPYRTIQDWELGNNPMPSYIYRLIEFRIQHDEDLHKA